MFAVTEDKLLVNVNKVGAPVELSATTAVISFPPSSETVVSINGELLHGASVLASLIFMS